MNYIDWIVVVFFTGLSLFVGLYAHRKKKHDTTTFFVAGRSPEHQEGSRSRNDHNPAGSQLLVHLFHVLLKNRGTEFSVPRLHQSQLNALCRHPGDPGCRSSP